MHFMRNLAYSRCPPVADRRVRSAAEPDTSVWHLAVVPLGAAPKNNRFSTRETLALARAERRRWSLALRPWAFSLEKERGLLRRSIFPPVPPSLPDATPFSLTEW